MTWVLIIWIAPQIFSSTTLGVPNNIQVTAIPGYTSKEDCEKAVVSLYLVFKALCIPGPTK